MVEGKSIEGVEVGNLYELIEAMAGAEQDPAIVEAGPPVFAIAVGLYASGGVHYTVHGQPETTTLAVVQTLLRAAFELVEAARVTSGELTEEEKTPH